MTYKYPVAKPTVGDPERMNLLKAIHLKEISSKGEFVGQFEAAFAKWLGVKHAVACSSGTAALTLAVKALGIGKGDRVIVPNFTMIASALGVVHNGAECFFVDCADDMNIDPKWFDEWEPSDEKAVMPVHLYGRSCDMDKVMAYAKEHDLKVIEDACEAHGATWKGKKVGTIGDIGCFSLFANKIITAGEGGVAVTNDDELAEKLRWYRSLCFDTDHTFLHGDLGFNFRMTNLQAAVALAQLERIDEFLGKRDNIRRWYDEKLIDYTIPRPQGSVLWMYDVVVRDSKQRESVMKKLAKQDIETRRGFKPMTWQPPFGGKKTTTSKADYFAEQVLYLPTYTDLTRDDVATIADAFLKAL